MYSKQEAARLKSEFWTRFGQYLGPIKNAQGQSVNWINYHSGVPGIYFRMDASTTEARISIEIRHRDPGARKLLFEKFVASRSLLEELQNENWDWEELVLDEDGRSISRISHRLGGVNLLQVEYWPLIISFLKARILLLDQFWLEVRDFFSTS